MIIDECQEKMNCLYSLVNVSSVISDLSIFITGWGGGGGEGVLAGTLGFQGERRGYQVYLFNLQHPPPPPLPPALSRAINNGRSFMITRDFVTVCPSP